MTNKELSRHGGWKHIWLVYFMPLGLQKDSAVIRKVAVLQCILLTQNGSGLKSDGEGVEISGLMTMTAMAKMIIIERTWEKKNSTESAELPLV